MPKRVDGGATSARGKKVVGLYINNSLNEKIMENANALSLSRGAYIVLAINEKIERDALRKQAGITPSAEEWV